MTWRLVLRAVPLPTHQDLSLKKSRLVLICVHEWAPIEKAGTGLYLQRFLMHRLVSPLAAMDDALLDALGILPRKKRHKRMLLVSSYFPCQLFAQIDLDPEHPSQGIRAPSFEIAIRQDLPFLPHNFR